MSTRSELAGRPAVRVAIVSPADPERLEIGGIATFIRGFIKFAPPEFEFAIIGSSDGRPLGRWGDVEVEGRRIRSLPVIRSRARTRGRIPIALRFTTALMMRRPRHVLDRWILSFHRPATELAFWNHRGPMWRAAHIGVSGLTTRGSESRWRRIGSLLTAVERGSFRRMDRIWVVNAEVAEQYRRQFPEVAERIRFLSNWVDTTIFGPRPGGERASLRSGFARDTGLELAGPLIVFVGRLEGVKDPLLAARTFAAYRRRNPAARLIVAGDGALAAAMKEELHALGAGDTSRLIGTIAPQQVAALMSAADLLLITSASETGPTVGLEALTSALPVVTTSVGEIGRLVTESRAGRVVEGRSVAVLADAVESVLAQEPAGLREACLHAAEPFAAPRVLAPLYEYNRELARGMSLPSSTQAASPDGRASTTGP